MKCEKCGCDMRIEKEHRSFNYFCPNCGEQFSMIYTPEIEMDEKVYELTISNNEVNTESIKELSRIIHTSYLESRKILMDGSYTIKGSAVEILDLKNKLDKGTLNFNINPDFKYTDADRN